MTQSRDMLSWVKHENGAKFRNKILIQYVYDKGTQKIKSVIRLRGNSGMVSGR